MRVRNTPYISDWEENRQAEIKDLLSRGLRPVDHDLDTASGERLEQATDNMFPHLMGKVAAVVNEKKTAKEIVDEMVNGAYDRLQLGYQMSANL